MYITLSCPKTDGMLCIFFEEGRTFRCRVMLDKCHTCNSNERNKKLCTKVDYFLLGHRLSWATAHFVRCNRIKMQSKQVLHNGIKRNKETYVT